jgi:hypothetical protein
MYLTSRVPLFRLDPRLWGTGELGDERPSPLSVVRPGGPNRDRAVGLSSVSASVQPLLRANRPARPPAFGEAQAGEPSLMPAGYGAAYSKLRAQALKLWPLCFWCRVAPSTEADHRIPVSRGGSDLPDNIIGACRPCNRSRGNRPAPPEHVVARQRLIYLGRSA